MKYTKKIGFAHEGSPIANVLNKGKPTYYVEKISTKAKRPSKITSKNFEVTQWYWVAIAIAEAMPWPYHDDSMGNGLDGGHQARMDAAYAKLPDHFSFHAWREFESISKRYNPGQDQWGINPYKIAEVYREWVADPDTSEARLAINWEDDEGDQELYLMAYDKN